MTITPATPAINTSQQPASAIVGTSIADKATVSGGYNPTGTVTFNLYNNSTATRHAAVHRHRDRSSGGVATSAGYTATATGTDYWVATYNGDSNNVAVTSGTALEPVSITRPRRDQHQPAAGHGHRRHLDRGQGHGQRRVQPDRHRHLQPLQQRDGQRHAAVHRHREPSRRRGHLGGLHRHRHGHRLLGRHLQRRQQQRRGHQRHGRWSR